MNIDLWLVFLGGTLLSAVLPGAGAILTLNHAFAGMAQDATADCRSGHGISLDGAHCGTEH